MHGSEPATGTHGGTHHQRSAPLLGRDVPQLRGLVDEAVHRQPHEVTEHDFDDGSQSGRRGAVGGAGERQLGDRRVEHALGPEPLEKLGGDLEDTARGGHVLAEEDHRGIALELLGERVADGISKLQRAHRRYSVAAN